MLLPALVSGPLFSVLLFLLGPSAMELCFWGPELGQISQGPFAGHCLPLFPFSTKLTLHTMPLEIEGIS